MKVLFLILIFTEMLLAILLFTPPFVDRHELAAAVMAYHREPSPENLRELRLQQSTSSQKAFRITLALAVLLAANTYGLFLARRRLKRVQAAASQPERQ